MKRYEHYGTLDGGGPAEAIEEADGDWVRHEDALAALTAERETRQEAQRRVADLQERINKADRDQALAVAKERERWRNLLEARAAGCERAAENFDDPKFDAMARVLMSVREDGSGA